MNTKGEKEMAENNLEKDGIKRLVLRLGVPSMLAQFINVLYSVVDRMYIGNIKDVGDIALAGVGICGPIVALLSAFASFVGVGGSPLMSIKMGEKDRRGASQILANSFILLLAVSIILTILLFPIKGKLLLWFGASEASFVYANEYFTVYLLGTVFALLSIGMNQFIISQGYAKIGMTSVAIGAVLNMILDPILIFVFHMGVKGAAIATIFSQFVSCCFVLKVLFGKQVPITITFKGYSLKVIRKIAVLGLTPFIIIVMDNVLLIALNAVLQKYGGPNRGDMLITCATIVQSFMLMITMPLGGITAGTQTILGYNYGARKTSRVLEAEKWIAIMCLVFTSVMFVISQNFAKPFVHIFTQNSEYLNFSTHAIKIYTLGIIPLAIQYTFVDGFTGMGVAAMAIPLSMFRKVVYLAGVFLIPVVYQIDYVFYSEPIADVISAIVTGTCYFIMIKKILRKRENTGTNFTKIHAQGE